jgi:small subunit ribosomal protein S2
MARARSAAGDTEGQVAGDEPLAEWERELLAGDATTTAPEVPAAEAPAAAAEAPAAEAPAAEAPAAEVPAAGEPSTAPEPTEADQA